MFGEEEIPFADDNGLPIVIVKLQSIRSLEALQAGDVKIPNEIKKLSASQLDEFKKNVATDKVIAERQEEKKPTQTESTTAQNDAYLKNHSANNADDDFYETSKQLASEEDSPF